MFTDADHTKLNGIEANATADQTNAEIRAAVEAATDSNVFTDDDHSKLDGIEALADVTDTVNVTAAGALMDSEVTNLSQVKAFDSTDYATAAQGSTADSALQNVVEDTTPQLGGDLASNGNDILFADNDKAIFGAGSDLKLYHTGSHSYIDENGTGNLYIGSNNGAGVYIQGSGETLASFLDDGAVTLNYDSFAKLATTSTGIDVTGDITLGDTNPTVTFNDSSVTNLSHTISSASNNLSIRADVNGVDAGSRVEIFDGTTEVARFEAGAVNVTGTVTADGLTVDGDGATVASVNAATGTSVVGLKINNTGGNTFFGISNSTGGGYLSSIGNYATALVTESATNLALGTNNAKRLLIDSGGDISFYEDTGTTAKLFWDASAESLGIGTTTPFDSSIHATGKIRAGGGTSGGFLFGSTDFDTGMITPADGNLAFTVDNVERMRISSGNVGIGTDSPTSYADTTLHVSGSTGSTIKLSSDAQGNADTDGFDISHSGLTAFLNNRENGDMQFRTNNTERMRIDSSGNVDITGSGIVKGMSHIELKNNGGSDGSATSPRLYSPASGTLAFSANGSERMRINSAGNVGIGTDSPACGLDVSNAGNGSVGEQVRITSTDADSKLAFVNTSGNGAIVQSSGAMRFMTNTANTERMRIDSSGRVGIGTSSPATRLHSVGAEGEVARIGSGSVAFSLGVGHTGNGTGYFNLFPTSSPSTSPTSLAFQMGGTERMRIDSSGNLLVGKTGTSVADTGVQWLPNGNSAITRSGGVALFLNRTSSDGSIVDFRKDNTSVGNIGTNSGNIYLSDGARSLIVDGDTVKAGYSTGGDANGAQDLGSDSVKWRNLYLSGGVYLGGTGSANKLDDYEEGTWTPTVTTVSGFTVGAAPSYSGTYVKIGKKVFIAAKLDFDAAEAVAVSDFIQLAGMPFSPIHNFDGVGSFHLAVNASADRGATGLAYNTGSSLYLWTTHIGSGAQAWNSVAYVQMAFEVS